MRRYRHIFFDLDHTLWDFYKNSEETLTELYNFYSLGRLGLFSAEAFVETYTRVNDKMWKDYNQGLISKEDIRNKRFPYTFDLLRVPENSRPAGINEDYLRICPSKGHLIPYAQEILAYLEAKYILHIITNGFSETQHIKIGSSGLADFFVNIINSESCGYLKPDARIFNYAIEKAETCCEDCIMVGDDLFADILGAREAGIDQVFFNRHRLQHSERVTYEIDCLSKLTGIL